VKKRDVGSHFVDVRGKRNRFGTKRQGDGPTIVPMRPVDGVGRNPRERFAGALPVTAHQQPVLDAIRAGVTSPVAIGRRLGRSGSSVSATLYALADRGLIERRADGWRMP
jgi:hypothetical protein